MKNLIFHSAATLTVTSFLSYGFGLVRDKTFAHIYGASRILDAYNAAFILPDLLLNLLVAGALTSAFLPVYTSLRSQKDEKYAEKVFCSLTTIAATIVIIIGALCLLFMPYLVTKITPGFNAEELQMVASLSSILLLSPLIFAISNSTGSVLVSHRQFLFYGLSPVFYNVGIILGTVFLHSQMGIYGTVIGTIFGALMHMSIRFVGLKLSGVKLYPYFYFKFAEILQIGRLMLPKMAGFGAWQLLLWQFTAIASTLKEGSITIYSFARNFQSVPVSLFGIAIATATFPVLSKHFAENNHEAFHLSLKKGLQKTLLLTVPSAIGMVILSSFIISFFLGGGRFGEEAIALTALTLSVYCISVPSESMMHLLARAFYARLDTFTPTIIQLTSIAITIGCAWHFVGEYGVLGIPIGFGIGSWVQVVLLGFGLKLKRVETTA